MATTFLLEYVAIVLMYFIRQMNRMQVNILSSGGNLYYFSDITFIWQSLQSNSKRKRLLSELTR